MTETKQMESVGRNSLILGTPPFEKKSYMAESSTEADSALQKDKRAGFDPGSRPTKKLVSAMSYF
jgi:hypothetical protein